MPPPGEVNHPGQLFRPAPTRVGVMPNMLVDAEDVHAVETGRIRGSVLQAGADLGPQRVPRRAQLASQPLDGSVLRTQLADRPAHCASGQQAARGCYVRILLAEGHHGAGGLEADPAAFAPPQTCRASRRRRIDQSHGHSTVAGGDDAASGTAGDRVAALDVQHPAAAGDAGIDEVHVGQIQKDVTPSATLQSNRAGARRMGHSRGP